MKKINIIINTVAFFGQERLDTSENFRVMRNTFRKKQKILISQRQNFKFTHIYSEKKVFWDIIPRERQLETAKFCRYKGKDATILSTRNWKFSDLRIRNWINSH